MEQALTIMAMANPRVLKEPAGFIKIIQVIIAIFAFATTCGFSSYTEFSVACGAPRGDTRVRIDFSYPFRIQDQDVIAIPVCNITSEQTPFHPYGNFSPPSQFYVFIGVVCFLYCLATIVLYVFFDDLYRKNDRIPIADFIVSVVITLMWLISASAWAHGLVELKFYTHPQHHLNRNIPDCMGKTPEKVCTITDYGNYAGLNVSIIFGFLNLFVWAGNLWFLFKETAWFKVRSKPAQPDPNVPPIDPQQVATIDEHTTSVA